MISYLGPKKSMNVQGEYGHTGLGVVVLWKDGFQGYDSEEEPPKKKPFNGKNMGQRSQNNYLRSSTNKSRI